MSKRMTRRQFLRGCLGIAAGAVVTPTCGLLYVSRIEPDWLQVERVAVALPDLPPPLAGLSTRRHARRSWHPWKLPRA